MTNWRPEGWKEIFLKYEKGNFADEQGFYPAGFEDGADAMLEALRKIGTHYSGYDYTEICGVVGNETVVFIPDD